MIQVLPGIKKVGVVGTSGLPDNVVSVAMAGITIDIGSIPEWLCLGGQAKVTVDDAYDNEAQFQKGTLEFKTEEVVPEHDVAFVIVDTNDNMWLFGQAEVPQVEMEQKKSTGAPGGEVAGTEYKAKFSAKKILIPCTFS